MSGADEISNVGGDCQSSNLANPGAIKFARDYDKEPVITKDYKQNLSLFSAVLTLALVIVVILISLFFL